ncbi:hypothetical protein KP509_1Z071900 [Ceratopteris richardii]|nr:hypothetical protein KP509_1Z071900 [Ceratopteris richardii]
MPSTSSVLRPSFQWLNFLSTNLSQTTLPIPSTSSVLRPSFQRLNFLSTNLSQPSGMRCSIDEIERCRTLTVISSSKIVFNRTFHQHPDVAHADIILSSECISAVVRSPLLVVSDAIRQRWNRKIIGLRPPNLSA